MNGRLANFKVKHTPVIFRFITSLSAWNCIPRAYRTASECLLPQVKALSALYLQGIKNTDGKWYIGNTTVCDET